MGRGRPPKPTAIKVLEGNPGHSALPSYEPSVPGDFPPPPDGMSDVARRQWMFLAPILHSANVLRQVDGTVLAQYCEAYAAWQFALAKVREEGAVVYDETKAGVLTKRNPWALERDAQSDRMQRLGSDLGLSPSSRARIVVLPSKKKEEDPKAKFKFGGRDVAAKIG